MPSLEHPLNFVVAVLIFQAIPGPGTLTILRITAHHGLRAGFAAVAGTLLGGLACMLAAACGLEALFRGQPAAIEALKWGGAVYLAWMGWRLIGQQRATAAAKPVVALPWHRHLRLGFGVSLTNPKVLLFYFALLPLFFRPPVTAVSLATMVACVSGISLAWQGTLVLGGNAAARWLAGLPSARLIAQRVAGVAFIGFAIKLFAF